MDKDVRTNFLENLRAADEPTKRKIVVIATIVCMVIIIFVWLAYFNPFVSLPAANPAVVNNTTQATTTNQ